MDRFSADEKAQLAPIRPIWNFQEPLRTARLIIQPLRVHHAAELLAFYQRNAQHLAPWEPRRPESFWQPAVFERTVSSWVSSCETGSAARFVLHAHVDTLQIMGTMNFNNVIGPPFQACTLGYSLDSQCTGQGFMREALSAGIKFMRANARMHRIMANHLPHNLKSAATLSALGFQQEGYAKDYLQIDGRWQDHVLTALTFADRQPCHI